MKGTCWLPNLECLDDYQNSWDDYESTLYSIFKNDFIENHTYFHGKQVAIRREPIEYGKEEAFFHVTCQDYWKDGNRVPDLRRCERIRWVRAFIEHYHCDTTLCEDCDGVKVWEEVCYGKKRVHILLEEERYMVVVEPRRTYCLLITAFYLEHDHALRKKLRHYEKYKNGKL